MCTLLCVHDKAGLVSLSDVDALMLHAMGKKGAQCERDKGWD